MLQALELVVPGAGLHVSAQMRNESRAVLYVGGNAEDVSTSLAEIAASFPSHSVYALHDRGYGRSTGQSTDGGLVDSRVVAPNLYEASALNGQAPPVSSVWALPRPRPSTFTSSGSVAASSALSVCGGLTTNIPLAVRPGRSLGSRSF